MTTVSGKVHYGKHLVRKITCPNCWHSFPPEDVLFIAKHTDLVGDPIAGGNEYLRFMPVRFNLEGEALDPRGVPTSDLACPRCHLELPDQMLEVSPLFISLVGSPASGKSYFLTALVDGLRSLMPRAFLQFTDADTGANSPILEYEKTLFHSSSPEEVTEIRKTQADDPDLHQTALIGDIPVRFPVPLQFQLWPNERHPKFPQAYRIGRIVVMYDNAGEDFHPQTERASSAAVRHLASSHVLFVMFDPTQDTTFRAQCHSDDPQLKHGFRPGAEATPLLRQESILNEAARRIRRYHGASQSTRLKKPLIVVVPKFDIWEDLPGLSLQEEPYVDSENNGPAKMNLERVEQVSESIRELFCRLCPDFVATAEGLSEFIRYVPVSSLGRSPEYVVREDRSFYGIRPKDIKPRWVTVPLAYCLCKWATGLIGWADAPRPPGRSE